MRGVYVRGRFLERIAPGIYRGEGNVCHLIIDELLLENGYADTDENRETMIAAAREHLATMRPPVILEVLD
jgi:hypothetical protein